MLSQPIKGTVACCGDHPVARLLQGALVMPLMARGLSTVRCCTLTHTFKYDSTCLCDHHLPRANDQAGIIMDESCILPDMQGTIKFNLITAVKPS